MNKRQPSEERYINKGNRCKSKPVKESKDTKIKYKKQPKYNKNIPTWFITRAGQNSIPSPTEEKIIKILDELDIIYIREVSFEGLQTSQDSQSYLRFDFFIPNKNLLIEYDGKDWHTGFEVFCRDSMKNLFAQRHKIKLIRFIAEDLPTLEKQIKNLLK